MTEMWYRIDAENGSIKPRNTLQVHRAAASYYTAPDDVVSSGRFRTPFAIYARKDQLTADEAKDAS